MVEAEQGGSQNGSNRYLFRRSSKFECNFGGHEKLGFLTPKIMEYKKELWLGGELGLLIPLGVFGSLWSNLAHLEDVRRNEQRAFLASHLQVCAEKKALFC